VASHPLRRAAHMLSNILIQPGQGDEAVVKASGVVHVYDPKRKSSSAFFSLYEYRLRRTDGEWRIAHWMWTVERTGCASAGDPFPGTTAD